MADLPFSSSSFFSQNLPILGFVARSGTGKTTLLAKTIPLLKLAGLRVGLIKHSHHNFQIDHPGKDSFVLRAAGANPVMIVSPYRRAVVTEHLEQRERSLEDELAHFDGSEVDLLLVEGYTHEPIPKIELHRTALDAEPMASSISYVIAIASDDPGVLQVSVPVLDINKPDSIADFILEWLAPALRNQPNKSLLAMSKDSCVSENTPLMPLEQALDRMAHAISPITEQVSVSLDEANGRILAATCVAEFDMPPFRNSAMDGYAYRDRDADIQSMRVVGRSLAGHPYDGEIKPGECIRIFTGAPMPPALDTVVMQEHVSAERDIVSIQRRPAPGANVRPAGDDARAGTTLLDAGKRLGAADIALLASAGINHALVTRRLKVAHFSTGDELAELGSTLSVGQIYDSNRYQLRSLLQRPFIESRDFGIVRDDPDLTRETLLHAADWADIILSSGGVSVGEADYVIETLADLGQIDLWKIALKPGKPFAFGRIGNAWFCGLPGNPVAVLVAFLQLVRPALLQLAGATPSPPLRIKATSTCKLRKAVGRIEFQRGTYTPNDDGELQVAPCGAQGSHRLIGASQANCLIVLPAQSAVFEDGESVVIEPLGELW